MNYLNCYQSTIVKVTGCRPEEAEEIENYMRDVIFQSTLDWQSKEQFDRAAREAHADILYMRTPEGQKYMTLLKLSMS
jgi:hypothetical protein